ncbi:MAG: acetoin utilization protein AcuC, partial [Clostridia bacterium]|nr:acetoin utilization protein AcuC [Clostridia bacterium]
MSGKAIFVYHPDLEKYSFKPDHPFNPTRLRITMSLLQELDLLKESDIVTPRLALVEELLLAHDQDYIRTVEKLSNAGFGEKEITFGIGTEDNPVFPDMHLAASLIVGATLTAGEEILEDRTDHAVSIAGGLHHAGRRQASGFCIYNDINVAIRFLCRKYHIRVLYI